MKLKSLIKDTFLSWLIFSHKIAALADQVESTQQQSDANEVPQCGALVDSIVTQYFDRASASLESYVANTYAATEQIDNTSKLHIDINYNEKLANADMVSGVSMGAYLVNMALNINDGTIQKLGSKTFFLNNKLQKLSLAGFGSLEIKYCPSKHDYAMLEVAGDIGNYELHINTNHDLGLNHVYANGNIKIQSSGKLLANDVQAGSNNGEGSIDIQAKTLDIKEDLRASKNILIHTDNINIPPESSLDAKHHVFVVAKSLARLDGRIVAGSRLVLRAEDEVSYDITKFHAKYIELQLAKASQVQFPNNIDMTQGFEHVGTKIKSKIVYEVIGDDPTPLQISNKSFFPHLTIKAPKTSIILGSQENKAILFGYEILIDAKSIDIYHGGVFGLEILCINSATDTKIGDIDFSKDIEFGEYLPSLPSYVGSNKLLIINSANKVMLHQAELIVPNGVAWMCANELDNIGSIAHIGQDLYWDIKQANHAVLYNEAVGNGARQSKPPGNEGMHNTYNEFLSSVQVKTRAPIIMVYGKLYPSQSSTINIKGGIFYAAQVNGPVSTNISCITQAYKWAEGGKVGHKNINKAQEYRHYYTGHEKNYPGSFITNSNIDIHTLRELVDITMAMKSNYEINSLLLHDMPSFRRLQLLNDAYVGKTTSTKKSYLNPSLLFEAAKLNVVAETALVNFDPNIAKKTDRALIAFQDQMLHAFAIANNVPIPLMSTVIDEKLFAAIKDKDLVAVQDALAQGANPNSLDTSTMPFLYSPLQLAITLKEYTIARLLAQQPHVNFRYLTSGSGGKTALDLVKENAAVGIVEYQDLMQIINDNTNTVDAASDKISHPVLIAEFVAKNLHYRDREVFAARYYADMQRILAEANISVLKAREADLWNTTIQADQYDLYLGLIEVALDACESGNLDPIRQLQEQSDELAWEIFSESNPLLLAIHHNNIGVATYLIDNSIGYLEILYEEGAESYLELASKAYATNMDLSEDSMLYQIATHMQQGIEKQLIADNKTIPNSEQLRLAMALYGQVLINRAQSMSQDTMQEKINEVLTTYKGRHYKFYEQRREALEAAYEQLATEFLNIFYKYLEQHGDLIAANAQYYADRVREVRELYEREIARIRHEHEEAQRRAKHKRKRRMIRMFIVGGITTWFAPELTVALIKSGVDAGVAAILTGTATGSVNSLIAGGNPIKGAVIGSAMSLVGYSTNRILTEAKLPKMVEGSCKILILPAAEVLINGGSYLDKIAMCAASNVIGKIVPISNSKGSISELQAKTIVRNLEELLKILFNATPALLTKGDKLDKLFNFAMQVTQKTITKVSIENAKAVAERNQRNRPERFIDRISDQKDISYKENVRVSSEFINHLEKQTNLKFTLEQRSAIRNQIKISRDQKSAFGYVVSLRNGEIKLGERIIVPNIQPAPMLGTGEIQAAFIVREPSGNYIVQQADNFIRNRINPLIFSETWVGMYHAKERRNLLHVYADAVLDGYQSKGDFIGEEVGRLQMGHETQTEIAFKTIGQAIGEDLAKWKLGKNSFLKYTLTERGWERTIDGAIEFTRENVHNAIDKLSNTTPEDIAKFLGHKTADISIEMALGGSSDILNKLTELVEISKKFDLVDGVHEEKRRKGLYNT